MHTAFIGLGANLPSPAGPPAETLAAAAARMAVLGRIAAISSLYSTKPVGYSDQPRFINAVLALQTDLSAHQLLHALLGIEREFGRDRTSSIPNGPRPLDLDILLFDNQVIDDNELSVPHPRLAERAFVLIPLREVAPQAIDPRSGKTVSELLRSLQAASGVDAQGVVRIHAEVWHSLAERLEAGT